MKSWTVLKALAAAAGLLTGYANADDVTSMLPKCPVMDEPVNLAVSIATDDGPVFFCCEGCIEKYKANPAKYAEKVAAQRKVLAKLPKVQVTCPVSGEPIDGKTSIEYNGKKVSFCCPMCVSKFKEHPEKYMKGLANSYTYQTKCPVTGEDIDPKAFATLAGGQRLYFCCPGCKKRLFDAPSKYASKLEAQGYKFEPEQIKLAKEGKDPGHDDGHGGHDHGGHP